MNVVEQIFKYYEKKISPAKTFFFEIFKNYVYKFKLRLLFMEPVTPGIASVLKFAI